MRNYSLIVILVSVFIFGYLVGGKDTKECVGLGFGAQGKYMLAASGGEYRTVWVLDTQEGHLWASGVRKRIIYYVGQVKIQ